MQVFAVILLPGWALLSGTPSARAADSDRHVSIWIISAEGAGPNEIAQGEDLPAHMEAMRNAFKHAQARQIEVNLQYDKRQFRMRVRDDGKGTDEKFVNEDGRLGHYGLPGMRERAQLLGGTLTVW